MKFGSVVNPVPQFTIEAQGPELEPGVYYDVRITSNTDSSSWPRGVSGGTARAMPAEDGSGEGLIRETFTFKQAVVAPGNYVKTWIEAAGSDPLHPNPIAGTQYIFHLA